jgi:hypothetical protein
MINKGRRVSLSLATGLFLSGSGVWAQVVTIPDSALTPTNSLYTNAFGTQMVTTGGGSAANIGNPNGRNDDGFRGPIPLGYTFTNFFGQDYTQFFLNNNGNISFGAGLAAFNPQGPQGATQPIIAPFFADVDTRGAASGLVYYNTTIPNETIITWDHVGYFNAHDDKLDTFQLVIRGPGFAIPAGEGQIGFFWTDMQWETGDGSGPGAVGFGDGQSNAFVLQGSTQNGISRIVNDEMVWFNLNNLGQPIPVGVLEPSTWVMMLLGFAGLGFAFRQSRHRIA